MSPYLPLSRLVSKLGLALLPLLLLCLSAAQAEAQQINIAVDSSSGKVNDVVSIPFRFSGTATNGLVAFEFRIRYDTTRLTPEDSTKTTPGSLGSGGISLGPSLTGSVGDESTSSSLFIRYSKEVPLGSGNYEDVLKTGPESDTGILHVGYSVPNFPGINALPEVAFTLQFTVKSTAPSGVAGISVLQIQGIANKAPSPIFADKNFNFINVGTLIAGSVTVGTAVNSPTVTNFSPLSGPVGTPVTINGSKFTGATEVEFNGVNAGAPQVVSSTQIKSIAPAGATSGRISVTTPEGTSSSPNSSTGIFKVSPKINSFTPTSATANETVTITGSNLKFGGVDPIVKIGTVTAPIVLGSSTPTEVKITVPATAITGKVSVAIIDTTSATATPAPTTLTGTSVNDLTVIKPPTITSLVPTSGAVGLQVTINGTNLSSVTDATFNGVSASAIQIISAVQIKATISNGATSGKVGVTNRAGTGLSASIFKIAPRINSFTPTSAIANETVTITGSNLKFGGVDPIVKIGTVTAPIVLGSSTPTEVKITVPAAAITGKISVAIIDNTSATATPAPTTLTGTSVNDLTVIKPPTITSLVPTSGAIGLQVTINGTNLSSVTDATFNGVSASAIQIISAVQIKATISNGATSGKVGVTNRAGTGLSVSIFKIAPRIDGFTPTSAIANETVTITGLNLKFGANIPVVKIGTLIAPIVPGSSTPTEVKITVPAAAITGKISVAIIDNTSATATPAPATLTGTSVSDLTVIKPPTITSLVPTSGAIGLQVTINGTNLSSVTDATFNGVSASAIQIISAAQIKATISNGATSGKVGVTNRAGTGLSVSIFKIAPRIDGFTPTSAIANETVTITGLNLRFGGVDPVVKIGTVTAPIVPGSSTPTEVKITVPATAITGKISVAIIDNTSATATPAPTTLTGTSVSDLTVIKPPTITSLVPTSGAIGLQVTINGTNLSSVTDATFNGVSASAIQIISAAQIKATISNGATSGKVGVTNRAGTGLSVSIFKIAPRIDGFTPTSATANQTVTITGLNLRFGGVDPVVKIGTVTAPIVPGSSTPTEVKITVPATAITGKISVAIIDNTSATATPAPTTLTGTSINNLTVIK